jgi:hypothetical protein
MPAVNKMPVTSGTNIVNLATQRRRRKRRKTEGQEAGEKRRV